MPVWNPQEDNILTLTSKLEKLWVQLANKKGWPKLTNQWPNTWCDNYKAYGHLAKKCPLP